MRLNQDLLVASPPGSVWGLCSPAVEHVVGQPADISFSCGYRNIQMVLSSLRGPTGAWPPPLAARLRDIAGPLPSVHELQTFIETAWAEGAVRTRNVCLAPGAPHHTGAGWGHAGFDPQGRAQLSGRLVGTRKWIGATEAAVVFRWLGLRSVGPTAEGY